MIAIAIYISVNLYNELGLLLTQCKEYKKAAECYKSALDFSDQNVDDLLPPVKRAALLQNLGAVLNSTENYQEAASYSQQAADIYGVFQKLDGFFTCFVNRNVFS